MAKEIIKTGLIGAGYWGKNLVRVLSQLGALSVICDSHPGRLREIGLKYPKAGKVLNYKDILEDKSISAVAIATPAESHYRLAKEALLAGKDVFVEKPLALSVEEGRELVRLARQKKKILMVGHLLQYHPAATKIIEMVRANSLGKLQYIYSNRLNLGQVRKEENILWSFAPHDISLLLGITGLMPKEVSVFGGNYLRRDIADVTISNFVFRNGVKAHIFVSWLHPYKEQKVVVIGQKAMLAFDDVAKKDKLLFFKHKVKLTGSGMALEKKIAQVIPVSDEEPLWRECRHFVNCLESRQAPLTDGKSALEVLKVLHACQVSLEQGGQTVFLNPRRRRLFYAHPTCEIEPGCRIGKGTKIWHYSHVMKGAEIGEDCHIGQNVFISSLASVADKVKVQNNVSIYDKVRLEKEVFCGPSLVFTNVINPRSHISRKDEYKTTMVREGATLGANATILCGITIGEYAFIGAGAVVTRDVPPYGLVYGNPARLKGWMCRCGVKLVFRNNKAVCSACSEKYKVSNGIIKCIGKG